MVEVELGVSVFFCVNFIFFSFLFFSFIFFSFLFFSPPQVTTKTMTKGGKEKTKGKRKKKKEKATMIFLVGLERVKMRKKMKMMTLGSF